MIRSFFILAFVLMTMPLACAQNPQRRVPAEWEPQEGVWVQWPRGIEFSYRPEMADIVDAIQGFRPVHLQLEIARHKVRLQIT